MEAKQILKDRLTPENFEKLMALDNEKLHKFVADVVELANPASVFVVTDAPEDADKIRMLARNGGGEHPLTTEGHTYHFDGAKDQARDPGNTKYLLPKGKTLGESLNSTDKEEGTAEVLGFFKDSMVGKEMYVCFYCLGPTNSDFSISCAQITDSPYVAHSENILYRPGYEQFRSIGNSPDFFRFMHTQGELDDNGCSKNIENRRIYMDLEDNIVYSTNTQYAGNTVGLKKLALRLAINKSSKEGWLAEHMFVMGVHGPAGRVTYFTGAFPSACGKTSTSMIPGQTIIGDDIAYFRRKDGVMRAVNVEQGIFGIIADVNPDDDPVIYKALTDPGEVIFGNVLISDKKPYWMGMGQQLPKSGINYQGQWKEGDEATPSHKNARYTLRISALANRDKMADDPNGVPFGAVIYGGRDSDTLVPVEQAFDWTEGIISKGASIESETTAATIGQQGVRKFNLMSNLEFLSLPLGRYIQNNLDFADGVDNPPSIFSTNYFLKDSETGNYLNGKLDKKVWILWAELRVNGDVDAIETPTGFIPKYDDLKKLFKENLNKDYTKEAYQKQFTIRVPNLIAKFDRVENIYRTKVDDTPQIVYDTFAAIKQRLNDAKGKYGEFISPFDLE